jgi:choline-sulfatase
VSRRVAVAALAALAGLAPLVLRGAPRRPNVVVIVVDTLRADHVTFMGHPRDTTPFLATLAARGVVFEKAWSTSGWTVPATASLFTSVYPQQHGMVENLGRRRLRAEGAQQKEVQALPEALKTLPEALKDAGYATFGVSDNYHIAALRGFERGFDRFFGDNNLGADAVNGKVLSWKAQIPRDRPYFLYVHYMDPHHPYLPRDPYFAAFAKDKLVPEWRMGRKAAYDSEVRYVDDHVKELYEALGWDRDTVIVFTSDHGEEFGEHGAGGHASSLYRELVHVPLLVSGGGYAARRVTAPVSLVDVLPTVREIAGLPPDPAAEGVSLAPALQGRSADARRTFFAHILTFGRGHEKGRELHAILRTRFKQVTDVGSGKAELYDMDADPWEKKNLVDTDTRTATDLAATYRRFDQVAKRYVGTTRTFVLDQETEEKLKALGYIQ